MVAAASPAVPVPDVATLTRLAEDLAAAWQAPGTTMRTKQRLVRLLIREIIVDVADGPPRIQLTIHWVGGRHSTLEMPKNPIGRHGHATPTDVLEVIRKLAATSTDTQIAATLMRLGLRTGMGHSWTEARVAVQRRRVGCPRGPAADPPSRWTLAQAAAYLRVSEKVVRKLIASGVLPATHALACAPWQIDPADLDTPTVRAAADARRRPPAAAPA